MSEDFEDLLSDYALPSDFFFNSEEPETLSSIPECDLVASSSTVSDGILDAMALFQPTSSPTIEEPETLLSIPEFDLMASSEDIARVVSSIISDDDMLDAMTLFQPTSSPTIEEPETLLSIPEFDLMATISDDDMLDVMTLFQPTCSPTMSSTKNIPIPPPLPCTTYHRFQPSRRTPSSLSRLVPKEAVATWDKLFNQGFGADTDVETDNKICFPAHSIVLAAASPVLAGLLNHSEKMCLKIPGVPYEAVYMFIRFLYSSCYDEEEMKKFVLQLLVLSHCYSIPSLKRVCIEVLDQGWINKENVIDVLQLAQNCDAARICISCLSMVIKDFKSVSSTEGWKVMSCANPRLEQELVEAFIESGNRKQERRKKLEDRKMYLEIYEAMEALVHICSEGCGKVGPRNKVLKGSETMCKFPACKGLKVEFRHFSGCKSFASCPRCKKIWQLLQLHSCICDDSNSCEVPLCWNFKVKMKNYSKKDQSTWRLLVDNIIRAKRSIGPFSSRLLV